MINREDFERTLAKDGRKPMSADVLYNGRTDKVVYAAKDFGKINFPVRKVTIQYEERSGKLKYIGNGDFVKTDRKKVRA